MSRKPFCELAGTFILVFAGAGAVVVDDLYGGIVGHLGIALVFGLVVMAVIHSIGDVSGAHINPAVTLGFWAARRLPGREVLPYVVAQCSGALLAALLLRGLFPAAEAMGTTVPAGPLWQSWVLEIVLTAILMFVILSVSTGAKEKGILAGAAIGAVVGLEALFAGPVSGASMNPARSLGPAVAAWSWGPLWIYLTAPFLGGLAAVPLCRFTRGKSCCMREAAPHDLCVEASP